VLATTCRSNHVVNTASIPSAIRYSGRFGRKRFTVRTTTSIHFFALEAAKLARDKLFAVATEHLDAFDTDAHFTAVVIADLLIALFTDKPISTLKTGELITLYAVERVFAITTEGRLAHSAIVELLAAVAICLVTLGACAHIFAFETQCYLALFAIAQFVALEAADSIAALLTEEATINALRLFANVAVFEMIPIGKVVTLSAANHANLGHFAVCAFLFGAANLPQSRTVMFTKASMQAKDLGKLLHRHETSNGSSVQKAEHRAAHEIFRKHLGEKHGWRRRMLLRPLSTPPRLHSRHGG
jgi:hypothetical protein